MVAFKADSGAATFGAAAAAGADTPGPAMNQLDAVDKFRAATANTASFRNGAAQLHAAGSSQAAQPCPEQGSLSSLGLRHGRRPAGLAHFKLVAERSRMILHAPAAACSCKVLPLVALPLLLLRTREAIGTAWHKAVQH